MTALTFLHFGVHSKLRRLPSFRGLMNLRSLKLAIMLALEEIPEFTGLTKFEHLVLPFLPRVDLIPDMAPIPNLLGFVISHRGRVCCNEFLDPSDCDLSRPTCYEHPSWRGLPIVYLPKNRTDLLATEATRRMFAKFPYSMCAASPEILVKENEYPE